MTVEGLIWRRRIADTETPVSAWLKLAQGDDMSFLLESVEGGAIRGRYSFLGLKPDLTLIGHGSTARIQGPNGTLEGDALTLTRTLIAACQTEVPPPLPRALPLLVGHFGFACAGLTERLPTPKARPMPTPDIALMRPTVLLVFDRLKDELLLVAPLFSDAGDTPLARQQSANARLDAAEAALDGPLPRPIAHPALATVPTPARALEPAAYEALVHTAKEHIAAGDIFQVVLAQRFYQDFDRPAFDLYRALRRINPSPYLFHLQWPDFAAVGSSPEILVRARDGEITVRPIAGTRRRGMSAAEDRALEADLLADPKERAEHLMLLDLGRNDVGRVATPGSVSVTEHFTIERYSHVMHIVSQVVGRQAPGIDGLDALLAGFPAGTVSGAPKVRAMEIIAALEPEDRGLYAGAVGYFGADGSMDSCIALRTGIVANGILHVTAGAGIVWDSDAAAENRECEAKAKALFMAAAEALAPAL